MLRLVRIYARRLMVVDGLIGTKMGAILRQAWGPRVGTQVVSLGPDLVQIVESVFV